MKINGWDCIYNVIIYFSFANCLIKFSHTWPEDSVCFYFSVVGLCFCFPRTKIVLECLMPFSPPDIICRAISSF